MLNVWLHSCKSEQFLNQHILNVCDRVRCSTARRRCTVIKSIGETIFDFNKLQLSFSYSKYSIHAWIQRGDRGSGPPSPNEKSQKYRVS